MSIINKKRILVIDDEEILTKTYAILLQRVGYDVYTVKSGLDAQAMLEEISFNLIICDLRMPGMSGAEIIKQFRQMDKKFIDTPVIFVTGFTDLKLEKAAKELKPIAFFNKPFDNQKMLETIKESIG